MGLSEIGYDENIHNLMVAGINKEAAIPEIVASLALGYVEIYGLKDVSDINHGMCDDFANDLCQLIPGAKASWGDLIDESVIACDSHCVTIIRGRYYDSECPKGSDTLGELPYFVQFWEIYENFRKIHENWKRVRTLCEQHDTGMYRAGTQTSRDL